jgi:hypothetical protein
MARVAEGRPKRRFISLRTVSYAASLVLILVLGTIVILRSRQPETAQHEQLTTPGTVIQQIAPPVVVNQTPEPTAIARSQSEPNKPADKDKTPLRVNRTDKNSNRGGGSFIEALPNKKQPNPEGIEPQSRSAANQSDVMISTPISVKELLDNLGMSVEFENGWRVKSVTENGVAQKTGIKTGDIITALGDREIDAKTSFNGVGSITSVTVNRDGKRVPLKLVLR